MSMNIVLNCVSHLQSYNSGATEWSLSICVWAIRGKLLYQGKNCPLQYTSRLCAEARRTVRRVAASSDELRKATRVGFVSHDCSELSA